MTDDDNPLLLLDEKIARLKQAWAIEAGTAVKFQLEQFLEEVEADRQRAK